MNFFDRKLSIGMNSYDVSSLHNILRHLGFEISEEETKKNLFGNSTENAIKRFQRDNLQDETGIADESTISSLYESAKEKGFFSIRGMVVTGSGISARGLQVIALDKNQGRDSFLGKTVTGDTGNYVILYKRENFAHNGKQNADIEIKITDLKDQTKVYGTSSVHFNADHDTKINIVLNNVEKVQDKISEFSQISNDLGKYVLNGSLGDLEENKDRQDISYLSRKTGLDARLVAMVSLSDRYSQDSQIRASFYYALFRSGISTNPDDLYKTNSEVVKRIWTKAIRDRIIDQSLKSQIDAKIQLYKEKQKSYLLEEMKPTGGVSSLGDLISLSMPQDEKKQKQFIDLYFNNNNNNNSGDKLEEFWAKVENQFGTDTMKKLQLDSKLGYLTKNNAPLIKKLESAPFRITNPVDLIKQGFYKKDKWEGLFVGNQLPIPAEIPGENELEKKENYINHMTLLLKKSYPTAVVSDMIKTDELKVNDPSVKEEICNSLNDLYAKFEFEIGTQPIEKVIKDNPITATINVGDKALKELKKLQRIYNITPSYEAMKVLWANNLSSALSIVQYDKKDFIETFGESFGGQEIASTVYSKAHQVHSTVLNLATTCMTYKVNPKIYALSQLSEEEGANPPIIENPTLEELFGGSLDYCECESCQSVLSPSSYLVDLLHFINLKKYDLDGNELPHSYKKQNPLDVLLDKRPDVEHIQLTCENTNTVLPYIDLVNEILEHYVVNHTLTGFKGFNTKEDITTEELLANPQFVNNQAYSILKNQIYPFNLPFNKPLEYLRLFYNHLKIELDEAMEILRVNDSLDVGETLNPQSYAWREIYNEFLIISPEEYEILTNSMNRKIPAYFGEDENMPFPAFRNKLSNAKVFARKTDITYKELIELVSTKFINPNSYLIPKVQKLAVSFEDIKGFVEGTISEAEFNDKIPADIKEKEQESPQYGGDILRWVRDNHDKIMNLIVLTFPETGAEREKNVHCRFDKLELRYSLPDSTSNHLKEIDFWCFLRFIRLWKKSGYTIEETDKIIIALYKKESLPKIDSDDNNINKQKRRLDDGVKDLIIKVAHIKKLMGKLSIKRSKLIETLSLWSNIDVQGKNSLYNRMFLNSTISRIDNVFDENGSGEYLQDTNQKIRGHINILQAAFSLDLNDISLIMKDARLTNDSQLSLENVSNIYRYSLLAKVLKLDVEELILLKQMSGIDPFSQLKEVNPDIFAFIDTVKMIMESKFKTNTLNYYLRHRNVTGESFPTADSALSLAKTIKDGLIRIEQENAVGNDPNGEEIKSKMALVYENTVVDRFFGLLRGVTQYTLEGYNHPHAELEEKIINASRKKIDYDDFAKQLTFQGVMTEKMKSRLMNLSNVSDDFKIAIDKLYELGQQDFVDFFKMFPELKELYDKNEDENIKAILDDFMPVLKKKLKQLFVKQTLSSSLDADLPMINELLENHVVLHSFQHEDKPLIEDFLDLEANGTSVQYFFSDEIAPGATPDKSEPISGNIDFFKKGKGENNLPDNSNNPGGKISAIWRFFIEAPTNAYYNFYVETEPEAKVRISIDGKRIERFTDANSDGVWSNKTPILLQSGKLYKIRLQITKVKDKAMLKWASKGIAKAVIPVKYLYPNQKIEDFENSYVRLLKAIGIIERLAIGEKEVSLFSTDEKYQIDRKGLLNSIPVNQQNLPNDATTETTTKLFSKLIDLLKYVSLKKSLNIKDNDDETLTSIFENPNAVDENGQKIILKVTKWDESFLSAILDRFGWKQEDIELSRFSRISEAFEMVGKFGVRVNSLLSWTTTSPSNDIIRNVRNILKSKYDESTWFEVLQSINDKLRSSQRNALVSYILQDMQKNDATKKINTPDKLFEYFLIDVQMDPCMKTSRIKQAISTTQLFIQRCLMNLEPRVEPSSIKKNQWEWMQRYRLAEANKKIFLYPENWLVPELRDIKSSFFKELEEEVLQEDMDDELAEQAMLHYLEKLDEVSKLEICAMYLQEYFDDDNERDKSKDVLHVVGRTSSGASRKYYYRRLEQSYWIPWELITAKIEDNPVLLVVWKNRLFMFWLNIIKKESNDGPLPVESDGKGKDLFSLKTDQLNNAGQILYEVNLCWSEYYNNRWQPTKTSDFKNQIAFYSHPHRKIVDMPGPLLSSDFQMIPQILSDGSLQIIITVEQGIRLLSINQELKPHEWTSRILWNIYRFDDTKNVSKIDKSVLNLSETITRQLFSTFRLSPLIVYFYNKSDVNSPIDIQHRVLNYQNNHKTISSTHYQIVSDVVDVPFFYQDENHVFLVKTKEGLVTVPNYHHVFTDRGKFPHDVAVEKVDIPTIREKPEIFKPISREMNDYLLMSSMLINPKSKDSRPIDSINNYNNPLKKVILDSNPVSYDGEPIGAFGSGHAHLLCNIKMDTFGEFESVTTEEEK